MTQVRKDGRNCQGLRGASPDQSDLWRRRVLVPAAPEGPTGSDSSRQLLATRQATTLPYIPTDGPGVYGTRADVPGPGRPGTGRFLLAKSQKRARAIQKPCRSIGRSTTLGVGYIYRRPYWHGRRPAAKRAKADRPPRGQGPLAIPIMLDVLL